jgi:hypothetical protein
MRVSTTYADHPVRVLVCQSEFEKLREIIVKELTLEMGR